MEIQADIALVGAGPLGIEMAVGLKRAGLSYVHLEAGQIGATMQWWAAGTRWFSSNERISIAGVPLMTPQQEKASREEYLSYLRSVVEQFNLPIETYTRVVGIEHCEGGFLLRGRRGVGVGKSEIRKPKTENGEPAWGSVDGEIVWRVKKVILATGGTERANVLGVPGEELPHVSHYFSDPHAYFQREVLIVGGRNSAVEAALRCHRAGAKVSFSYRGAGVDVKDIKYWLYPEFSGLVQGGKIRGHFGTCVKEITETGVRLTVANGELEVVADFVLLLTGYVADMSLAVMAGVEVRGDDGVPVFDAGTMETNVPGVYVAGTAVAGTQRRYKVFLENCHVHVGRIIAHLTGRKAEGKEAVFERPES